MPGIFFLLLLISCQELFVKGQDQMLNQRDFPSPIVRSRFPSFNINMKDSASGDSYAIRPIPILSNVPIDERVDLQKETVEAENTMEDSPPLEVGENKDDLIEVSNNDEIEVSKDLLPVRIEDKITEEPVDLEAVVEVSKNVEPELAKDNGVDVVLLIGEGSDENIMEMDLAMMEQQSLGDTTGEMEGMKMEVFNEVVLEEILQNADRSSKHFPYKVLWLGLGIGSVVLALLLLSILFAIYCWRRNKMKKLVISDLFKPGVESFAGEESGPRDT